jgi:hypothetical protein
MMNMTEELLRDREDPDPPAPPSQTPAAPVKEPPDEDPSQPNAPVDEPGPEPEKHY